MSRFLQVILAMVGLVLTAVLQLASNRNAEVQNAQAQVQLYAQLVSAALERCNLPMLYVAQDTAQELNDLRDRGVIRGNTDFESHLEEVRSTMTNCAATAPAIDPSAPPQQNAAATTPTQAAPAPAAEAAPIAPEFVSRSQNLELRGIERRVEQQQNQDQQAQPGEQTRRDATAGRYYAVLASYAVGDRATYDTAQGLVTHFNQLTRATQDAGVQLQVYRTTVSNHFAIVIAADSDTAARDLVNRARSMGWAPDAFIQPERDWVRCENPSSLEGLRACAGSAINRGTSSVLRRAPAPSNP